MGGTYLCWSISDRKKPAVDGWSKKCQQLGHGRRLLWWWGHPDLTPPLRKCFTDKKSVFLFQKFDFIHSLCPHTAEESHHQEMQRNCGGGKSKRFLSKIAHLSETKYELWQRERGVNSPNTTSEDHEMLLIVFVFWGDLFRRYQFGGYGMLFCEVVRRHRSWFMDHYFCIKNSLWSWELLCGGPVLWRLAWAAKTSWVESLWFCISW